MSFLIATPELGLDAVFLSIPLLGGEMTLIRVTAAALVALLVGRIVGAAARTSGSGERECGCHQGSSPASLQNSFCRKLALGLRVGFGEVVDHTAPWILVGLGVAAVAEPLFDSGWLAGIGPLWDVPVFALLGLPAYVCASGATPLVAILLVHGVSPGAAIAFLLTGPATNVTTFGLLGQLHGRKTAVSFSATIIGLSVGLGYVVNYFFLGAGLSSLDQITSETPATWQLLSAGLLFFFYVFSIVRTGARKFVAELFFQNRRALDIHPHYH